MAKNRIQFQKGLSLTKFLKRFGTEGQCAEALARWRWPGGFVCPACGARQGYVRLRTRKLFQCKHCRHQTSLTAGTLFAHSKLPLTTWFLALYLLTQQKNGISALELKRHLGVSYPTAWSIKHKLLQAMLERDAGRKLSGIIQLDDVYWGGERRGAKPGRGSPNKVPFIAAVATNQEGHPIALRMSRLSGFRKAELQAWAEKFLDPDAMVLTDGLACFRGIAAAGLEHQPLATGGGPASVELPEMTWVNTIIGNVKGAMRGSYHNASGQHLPRYLAEFCYRFNRRFNLATMLPRLAWAALRTPPMPYRLLKLAEVHW